MKILILGHGRHGKDTVAEMIHNLTGLTFTSSSYAALDAIYPALSYALDETDKEKLFAERHNHRELWKRLIALYNTPNRAALARLIVEKSDIYVGMRCGMEYCASRNLFDRVLWVDRSRHKPEDPTMLIRYREHRMHWVDNNGTLDETRAQVEDFLHWVGLL